jgi:hypothetical protein
MTVVTINGVEYMDFKARFVTVDYRGFFEFIMQNEPGADPRERWTARHSLNDQEPLAGSFGLPEWDGRGTICPNIHTCRLRLGWARAQGIL